MSATEMMIHVLRAGLPLCGFSNDIPANWPEGHLFVSVEEIANATCHRCRIAAVKEDAARQILDALI
jgi:hypothetical protein